MAVTFTASTNRLTTNFTATSLQRTFWFVCNRVGDGTGGLGRIFDRTASGLEDQLFWNQPTGSWFWQTSFSGSRGTWGMFGGFSTTPNQWNCFVVSVDKTNIGVSAPIAYSNNNLMTVSQSQAPAGTPTLSTNAYVIGNRADGGRGFDGHIAGFAMWHSILPSSVMLALSNFQSPLLYPKGLVYFNPMWDLNSREIIGRATSTYTGGTASANGRMILAV